MKLRLLFITATCIFTFNNLYAQISPAGLVALWKFDSNAGDSSGNSNHGTAHNVTYGTGKYGAANSAAKFDGTTSYIEVPYSSTMNLTRYSICATIKLTGFYTGQCQVNSIMTRGLEWSTGNYGMHFIDSDGSCTTYDTNKYTMVGRIGPNDHNFAFGVWKYSPVLHSGQWVSAVITFDSVNVKVYLNGSLKITNMPTGTILPIGTSTDGLFIGAAYATGGTPDVTFPYWYNGYMDDLRIYNRVLTTSEITSYNTIDSPTAIANIPGKLNAEIYPNPSQGTIYIQGNGLDAQSVNVQVLNTMGQSVYREQMTVANGQLEKQIDLGNIANGVYIVHISSETGTKVSKITIER